MVIKKYFVIIPVHNEQKHIARVIKKVYVYNKNIIVVNDGSNDKTKKILDNISYIKSLHFQENKGKGAAMREGAKLAWKLKAAGIVFMDGDNQHDPCHLPTFIKHLKDINDLVIGVRILKTAVPLYRKIGNILLITGVRLLFDITMPDLLCGYRGMTKKGYRQIKWKSNGYGVEAEMITIIGQKKVKFKTVVVNTKYIDKYKGFSIKDGLIILFKLPIWKFVKNKKSRNNFKSFSLLKPLVYSFLNIK